MTRSAAIAAMRNLGAQQSKRLRWFLYEAMRKDESVVWSITTVSALYDLEPVAGRVRTLRRILRVKGWANE